MVNERGCEYELKTVMSRFAQDVYVTYLFDTPIWLENPVIKDSIERERPLPTKRLFKLEITSRGTSCFKFLFSLSPSPRGCPIHPNWVDSSTTPTPPPFYKQKINVPLALSHWHHSSWWTARGFWHEGFPKNKSTLYKRNAFSFQFFFKKNKYLRWFKWNRNSEV